MAKRRRRKKSGNNTKAKQHLYLTLLIMPIWAMTVTLLGAYLAFRLAPAIDPTGREIVAYSALFVFLAFPLCKIGITGDMSQRMGTIDRSTPGFMFVTFDGRLPNAYGIEQALHAIFGVFRREWVGSGKTEYFLSIVLFIAWPICFFIWIMQYIIYIAAFCWGAYLIDQLF